MNDPRVYWLSCILATIGALLWYRPSKMKGAVIEGWAFTVLCIIAVLSLSAAVLETLGL